MRCRPPRLDEQVAGSLRMAGAAQYDSAAFNVLDRIRAQNIHEFGPPIGGEKAILAQPRGRALGRPTPMSGFIERFPHPHGLWADLLFPPG
jgi:hypothetical protein